MDDTTSNVALQVHPTEQSSQVQVFVRMVPLQKDARRENFELERRVIRLEEPGGQRVSDFVFDGVFPENAAQNHVYQKVAAPLVDNLMQGINSCCLAYGQTGSGKTYSIFGVNGSADKDERRGISHRVVEDLMSRIEYIRSTGCVVSVKASFIEIYMDNVYNLGGGSDDDLDSNHSASETERNSTRISKIGSRPSSGSLASRPSSSKILAQSANTKRPASAQVSNRTSNYLISSSSSSNSNLASAGPTLEVLENAKGDTFIRGLPNVELSSTEEGYNFIEKGLLLRRTGSTSMNLTSSRSHVILSLVVVRQTSVNSSHYVSSRINLVDLAGSERVKKSESEGLRLKEARSINTSLSALGNVVRSLHHSSSFSSKNFRGGHTDQMHIPYRDTKLTRVLKDSLSGNSRTVLLATLFGGKGNYEECLNTLQFAASCTDLRTKPRVNYQHSQTYDTNDPDTLLKSGVGHTHARGVSRTSPENVMKMSMLHDEVEKLRDEIEATHTHYHGIIEQMNNENKGRTASVPTESTSAVKNLDVDNDIKMKELKDNTHGRKSSITIPHEYIKGAGKHKDYFSNYEKDSFILKLRFELDANKSKIQMLTEKLNAKKEEYFEMRERSAGEEARRSDSMRKYREKLRALETSHAEEKERLANETFEALEKSRNENSRLQNANDALRRQLDEVSRSKPARRKENSDYDRDIADAVESIRLDLEKEQKRLLGEVKRDREKQIANLKEQAEYFIAQKTEENERLNASFVAFKSKSETEVTSLKSEAEYLARHCIRYSTFLAKMERGDYVIRKRGERRSLSVPRGELPRKIDLTYCTHTSKKLSHIFKLRTWYPSVFYNTSYDEDNNETGDEIVSNEEQLDAHPSENDSVIGHEDDDESGMNQSSSFSMCRVSGSRDDGESVLDEMEDEEDMNLKIIDINSSDNISIFIDDNGERKDIDNIDTFQNVSNPNPVRSNNLEKLKSAIRAQVEKEMIDSLSSHSTMQYISKLENDSVKMRKLLDDSRRQLSDLRAFMKKTNKMETRRPNDSPVAKITPYDMYNDKKTSRRGMSAKENRDNPGRYDTNMRYQRSRRPRSAHPLS